MYFDTNGDENSHTVVTKSGHSFRLPSGKLPIAIIAGAFELSVQFWFERNILGRLLSVAMGASNLKFSTGDRATAAKDVTTLHKNLCNDLGFGPTVCDMEGRPMIISHIHRQNWQVNKNIWNDDICKRLTNTIPHRKFHPAQNIGNMYLTSTLKAASHYWNNFPMDLGQKGIGGVLSSVPLSGDLAKLGKHVVPHTGLILDTVNSVVLPSRLSAIITDDVAKLGFNLVQLRLVDNNGFSFQMDAESTLQFSLSSGPDAQPYRLKEDLAPLVKTAARLGIEMMPEISVSSDGGGWFKSGFVSACPQHFCNARTTPNAVNDPMLLSVLLHAITALREVFSSKFLHLGSDERIGSQPCFEEMQIEPDFDGFESRLTALVELNGIPRENILRTENLHHRLHEGRTGSITQLRKGSSMTEPDDIVFYTVDVEDGDGWSVYQRTKELMATEPLGIMAEVRALLKSHWDKVQLPKRLLAFSMALSELPTAKDPASFNESFQALCQALSLDTDCTPPGKLPVHTTYVVDSDIFRKKVCDARTMETQKHVAKFVPPYYDSIVRAKFANATVADKKK
jgi:hypothetical protein